MNDADPQSIVAKKAMPVSFVRWPDRAAVQRLANHLLLENNPLIKAGAPPASLYPF
jgi:hypothetical protein